MIEFSMSTKAEPFSGRCLAKGAVCILAKLVSDNALLYDLDLALTEACSNVVRHAYPKGEEGDLEITVRVEPYSHVELEVADWGVGLDKVIADFKNPAPDAESGRGLFIIKSLMDVIEVRREGAKNIIFFHKKITRELWRTCM